MNGSKNVFVVETPLQLLNAIEAKHRFEDAPASLVLLDTGLFSRESLDRIAATEAWSSVLWAEIKIPTAKSATRATKTYWKRRLGEYHGYWEQHCSRRTLTKLARSLGAARIVFLGNYLHAHMRHFASCVPHESLYLLDDGTDTLRISQARLHPEAPPSPRGLAKVRAWMHRVLHEWNAREAPRLTFFTAYDFETLPGDSIIKNDYDHFRSLYSMSTRTDEVYFLGQPLVGDGYLTRDAYFDLIERVKTKYDGEDIVYVPHKREDPVFVAQVKDATALKVRSFELPIEFELVRNGKAPRAMASFFCSALENCRLICGDAMQIDAFYISPQELAPGCEFVEDIYTYFASKASPAFRVVKT